MFLKPSDSYLLSSNVPPNIMDAAKDYWQMIIENNNLGLSDRLSPEVSTEYYEGVTSNQNPKYILSGKYTAMKGIMAIRKFAKKPGFGVKLALLTDAASMNAFLVMATGKDFTVNLSVNPHHPQKISYGIQIWSWTIEHQKTLLVAGKFFKLDKTSEEDFSIEGIPTKKKLDELLYPPMIFFDNATPPRRCILL